VPAGPGQDALHGGGHHGGPALRQRGSTCAPHVSHVSTGTITRRKPGTEGFCSRFSFILL